ncbi:hypothetical protein [Nocardia carnea]|uniref:hypothetical protein n=1 Tax=Nocardia carnea TaxID=37328 RepID=UPI002455CCBF|nr:hypothetical protein [Nocardia carnea]
MTETDAGRYLAHAQHLIVSLPAGGEFTVAALQHRMTAEGWPRLTEPRALGGMMLRLRARGIVRRVAVKSTALRSHGGTASVWQRTDAPTPAELMAGAAS